MSGQQIEQLLNKLEFLVTLINKNELFPFTARDQECVSGVLSERDPSGQYHCPLSDPVDPELTIRVSCPHCPEGSELASSLVYAAIKRGILLIAMEICRVQFHPELDSNLPDSLKTLLSSIAKIANGSTHTSDRATSRTGSSMDRLAGISRRTAKMHGRRAIRRVCYGCESQRPQVQAPFFSSLEFNQIGLVSAGQNHATIPSITATSLPLQQNINAFKI